MNLAESAAVETMLRAHGWQKAPNAEVCDMAIINTCSVRATAETRIFGRLGYYAGLKAVRGQVPGAKERSLEAATAFVKKHGPVPLTLVVMGCMAERLLHSLKKDFPVVDYVVGTYAKQHFEQIIAAVEKGLPPVEVHEEPAYSFAPLSYEQGAFSSFVPIMHGCNNFCTYCIVPYVRGREISRPAELILRELDELSKNGVKEIQLLGQNVNSYQDENGITFPRLLKKITAHLSETDSPIRWIRFDSSHPKDLSDELIEVMATEPRVCRQLHLPVQHGSTAILSAMNRRYSREDYLGLVQKIRASIPDIALSTDIMLGFPGESDADFEQALSLLLEVRYESAFMYYFNPREGTPAAAMPRQVPLAVKKERLKKTIDVQHAITTEMLSKKTGTTCTVLADVVSRDDPNELLGKTEADNRVAFAAPRATIGTFVDVHLDSISGNTFRGHRVS